MEASLKENRMGTEPVGKLLIGMSLPLMMSMLVQGTYNLVDSMFVAQLSENAMNAVSLAFPLQNFIYAVGSGTMLGMHALISRNLGAKRQDLANKAANTGVFLGFCSYLVCVLIALFFSRSFFEIQTNVIEIIDYGEQYISVCLFASLGVFEQFCFERILQATGRTKLTMIPQVVGAVVNIILDPIMIFGWLGFPRLEVLGAAIATVISQVLSAVIAFIFAVTKNKEIKLRLREMRFDAKIVKEIYRIGLPSSVEMVVGSVMTFFLNKILINFTTTATAFYGIFYKLQMLIFQPMLGVDSAMVSIVSYNYGAKKLDRLKKTAKLSILTAEIILFVGFLLFEIIPGPLLSMFNASENMYEIGIPAMRIAGTNFLFAGYCVIAGAVCQAIGNPFHWMITSACRSLVVLVPAMYLLSLTGNLELVWLSFPIAEISAAGLVTVFLRKTMRRAEEESTRGLMSAQTNEAVPAEGT